MSLIFPKIMNKQIIIASLLAPFVLAAKPVLAINWTFSFSSNGGDASGVITTDGIGTPQANKLYNISAITGTFTPTGGSAETITGISGYQSADNTIEWDGTKTSPILVNGYGFSFDTSNDAFNVFQNTGTGYLAATSLNYSFADNTITSSNFAPVPSYSPQTWQYNVGFVDSNGDTFTGTINTYAPLIPTDTVKYSTIVVPNFPNIGTINLTLGIKGYIFPQSILDSITQAITAYISSTPALLELVYKPTNYSPPIGVSNIDFPFSLNLGLYGNFNGDLSMNPNATTPITGAELKLTPVPFEFSPEQGFILGIPLFWGLRKLKSFRGS